MNCVEFCVVLDQVWAKKQNDELHNVGFGSGRVMLQSTVVCEFGFVLCLVRAMMWNTVVCGVGFVLCQVRVTMPNTVVCDVGFVSGQGDDVEH